MTIKRGCDHGQPPFGFCLTRGLLTAWCQQPAAAVIPDEGSKAKPMRDHLAHDIRQRFIPERRNWHPAHSLRRTGASGNACGMNHKLKRKMCNYLRADACFAVPAHAAFHCGTRLYRALAL